MAYDPHQPPSRPSRAYDDEDDYQYYWSFVGLDIPIPRWLAEIMDVPLVVRWEIFLVGLCAGLVVAAFAVFIAFISVT